MTYKYLYQTRENENRQGEIKARNRAEAYAALRKQGIRPYRLIGDDPKNWRPWAIAAAFAVLAAAAALAIAAAIGANAAAGMRAEKRAQLAGDAHAIAEGAATSWQGVFDSPLDRHLAAYAQPGWLLEPPPLADADKAAAQDALARPLERSAAEPSEVRQLKNIVEGMRGEMRSYIAAGGTVEDYLAFLAERQAREANIRAQALETLSKAPADIRARTLLNLNIRLADLGLAPLAIDAEREI